VRKIDESKKELSLNDPLSLETMRLGQDFGDSLGVKKKITTIPIRRPRKHEFVRVHPSPDYSIETAIFEDREENEVYFVSPEMRQLLGELVVIKALRTSITRQRVLFLWPIKVTVSDGRLDTWNASSFEASKLAHEKWVRVAANRSLQAYEVFEASGELDEPEWPELSLQEIVRIAFKDRVIDSVDHPASKRLRGEI
jgi:hypothetical protein